MDEYFQCGVWYVGRRLTLEKRTSYTLYFWFLESEMKVLGICARVVPLKVAESKVIYIYLPKGEEWIGGVRYIEYVSSGGEGGYCAFELVDMSKVRAPDLHSSITVSISSSLWDFPRVLNLDMYKICTPLVKKLKPILNHLVKNLYSKMGVHANTWKM